MDDIKMTEKEERYEAYDNGTFAYIKDTEIYWQDKEEGTINEIWPVCKKLNEYDKENRELKKEIQKLKQFHDKVYQVIDNAIAEEFNNRIKHDDDELLEYYKGRHTMLEDLKKELFE